MSSENKGADQLCSYCRADLHLCVRICMLSVLSSGKLSLNLIFYEGHSISNAILTIIFSLNTL